MFNNLEFLKPSPKLRELLLLIRIEKDPTVSQNKLADFVHISPSMVNSYMKDFVEKGLIRTGGSTPQKMTYNMTEKGTVRVKKLLSAFLNETIHLHLETKDEYKSRIKPLKEAGIKKIVFYGSTEIAEITLNVVADLGMEVIGVVDGDPEKHGKKFAGLTIQPPSQLEAMRPDAVVIASLKHKNEIYKSIKHLEEEGIKVRAL